MIKQEIDEKSNTNYKYLLHQLLNELPHSHYKVTVKELPKKLGVSPETFRKWKYIKTKDKATIPGDTLAIIAHFFQIPLEKIFNYEIPKLTYKELQQQAAEKN